MVKTQTTRPSLARRRRSVKTMDNTARYLMAALGVFLLLCSLSLIQHSERAIAKVNDNISFTVGDPDSFFDAMGPLAQAIAPKYDLYPSVMLAQAALESQYGKSQLSFDYNNYFGIKAHDGHQSVRLKTTEYYNNTPETITDGFCVYRNPADSFSDYAKLLGTSQIYASVPGADSPNAAARAIQASGYATDPYYASKIISIITEYDLQRFDKVNY